MDNGAIGISQDELQDLLDAFADELKPILHKKKTKNLNLIWINLSNVYFVELWQFEL